MNLNPGALFIAVAMSFLSSSAMAQGLGLGGGIQIGHPYQVGAVDDVDLNSGNLALNIPIASYPEKGDLFLSYSLRYTAKQYSVQSFPFPGGGPGYENAWAITTPPGSQFGPRLALDQDINIQQFSYVAGNDCDPSGPYIPKYASVPLIYTADGAAHTMLHSEPSGNHSSGYWKSLDTLGFRSVSQSSYNIQYSGAPPPATDNILDKDGVLHYTSTPAAPGQDTVLMKDAHGNEITINTDNSGHLLASLTDTIGRQLPWDVDASNLISSNKLGTPTSDYSSCTGPLPIASAIIVTFPGPPQQSTLQYKLCYVTVNIKTNFNVQNSVGLPDEIAPYVSATGANVVPSVSVVQSVVLPNKTAWTFGYNDAMRAMTHQ